MLGFERETVLDLIVNVIPLVMILFFAVLFVVVPVFEWDPFYLVVGHALLVIPFVLLALLTYLAGKVVAGAEANHENESETQPIE